ncbi:MAG: response regulator [Thermoplasmata archaeon]|nr:response regulator [Thermoplasmata archaeon]
MAHLLVVEDDATSSKLVARILEREGHDVLTASDARAAEDAIAQRLPDLIVMDLALPGKDGYALTRQLRADPRTVRVPILALSAFAMPGDAERALEAGCTDYLTKPIRRELLLERLRPFVTPARPAPVSREPSAVPSPGAHPQKPESR